MRRGRVHKPTLSEQSAGGSPALLVANCETEGVRGAETWVWVGACPASSANRCEVLLCGVRPPTQPFRSQRSEMVRRRFELAASAQGQFVAVIGPLLPRTLSHSWSCVVVWAMTLPCRSLQVARAATVTA